MSKTKKKRPKRSPDPRLAKLLKRREQYPDEAFGKSMQSVGYSEVYSKNPNQLKSTDNYKEATFTAIKLMTDIREKILLQMSKHLDSGDIEYQKLNASAETINKNLRLLQGESTDNTAHIFKIVE